MSPLAKILSVLQRHYRTAKGPRLPSSPFALVLWENVAYLADDTQRQRAFDLLRKSVGTQPTEILAASPAELRAVASHGILPGKFAAKLRKSAQIARDSFRGGLDEVVRRPLPEAKRALRKFPGIGEPGAEKILLFSRRHAFLAPDSNALRVLTRLGFIDESWSYARAYAAARKLSEAQLPPNHERMTMAHRVLRRHGQKLCRRTTPLCGECPVENHCAYARLIDKPVNRRK